MNKEFFDFEASLQYAPHGPKWGARISDPDTTEQDRQDTSIAKAVPAPEYVYNDRYIERLDPEGTRHIYLGNPEVVAPDILEMLRDRFQTTDDTPLLLETSAGHYKDLHRLVHKTPGRKDIKTTWGETDSYKDRQKNVETLLKTSSIATDMLETIRYFTTQRPRITAAMTVRDAQQALRFTNAVHDYYKLFPWWKLDHDYRGVFGFFEGLESDISLLQEHASSSTDLDMLLGQGGGFNVLQAFHPLYARHIAKEFNLDKDPTSYEWWLTSCPPELRGLRILPGYRKMDWFTDNAVSQDLVVTPGQRLDVMNFEHPLGHPFFISSTGGGYALEYAFADQNRKPAIRSFRIGETRQSTDWFVFFDKDGTLCSYTYEDDSYSNLVPAGKRVLKGINDLGIPHGLWTRGSPHVWDKDEKRSREFTHEYSPYHWPGENAVYKLSNDYTRKFELEQSWVEERIRSLSPKLRKTLLADVTTEDIDTRIAEVATTLLPYIRNVHTPKGRDSIPESVKRGKPPQLAALFDDKYREEDRQRYITGGVLVDDYSGMLHSVLDIGYSWIDVDGTNSVDKSIPILQSIR